MRYASSQDQSLYVTVVTSSLRALVGSLEKFFKSFISIEVIHWAVVVVLKTVPAKLLVMMLQTLPESIIEIEEILMNCVLALSVSNLFAVSIEKAST